MAIAYKHLSGRVPRPRADPPSPGGAGCFRGERRRTRRELRPESASEMRRDLEAIARDLPPASPLAAVVAEAPDGTGAGHDSARGAGARDHRHDPRVERRRRRGLRPVPGRRARPRRARGRGLGRVGVPAPHHTEVPTSPACRYRAATAKLNDAGCTSVWPAACLDVGPARRRREAPPGGGASLERGGHGDHRAVARAAAASRPSGEGRHVPRHDRDPAGRLPRRATAAAGGADRPRRSRDGTAPAFGQKAPLTQRPHAAREQGTPARPVPRSRRAQDRPAKGELTSAGSSTKVVERFSNSAALGVVIGADRRPGARPRNGSAVTLTVSKGPQTSRVRTSATEPERRASAGREREDCAWRRLPVPAPPARPW